MSNNLKNENIKNRSNLYAHLVKVAKNFNTLNEQGNIIVYD